MPISATSKNRFLTFHSDLDDKLIITHFHGHEKLGAIYEYRVELLSQEEDIAFDKIVGKPVCVEMEVEVDGEIQEPRLFHGYVSEFRWAGTRDKFYRYQATVRPWLWFLSRTADCRIFQNKTVVQIIEQIFKDNGTTDYEKKLNDTYRTWEYCVQYRETDMNFAMRLMEQEGIYFYFRHEKKKHVLVLCDGVHAHKTTSKYEKIPYFPPEQGMRERDHIDDWSVSQSMVPSKVMFRDYDFTKPKTDLSSKNSNPFKHPMVIKEPEIYDYPGEYTENTDGTNFARHRMESLAAQHERILASGNAKGIAVGNLFKLQDFPKKSENEEHLVTAATYEIQCDDIQTTSSSGDDIFFHCQFEVLKKTTQFRTEQVTPKPVVQGPQTAVVVGPSGEEIYCDEHGRIKVQFHWDREGKKNENSSCWIRVSTAWAGKNWGSIHLPRIGHEVVVDFLEGDPDRPLVTGSVYNAENKPPYDLPANKTQAGFMSRSTKGANPDNFNQIRFEDKIEAEEFRMQGERTMLTGTKQNRKTHIGGQFSEGGDGSKASKHCPEIEKVNEEYHVWASREATIEGNEELTIAKDGGAKKGRIMTVENADHKTTVKKGDHNLQVDMGNKDVKVKKGNITTTADLGNITTKASAGEITIQAMKKITLKVGGSSLVMDPTSVTIKSTMIKVQANATLEAKSPMTTVEGSGMMIVKGGLVKIN